MTGRRGESGRAAALVAAAIAGIGVGAIGALALRVATRRVFEPEPASRLAIEAAAPPPAGSLPLFVTCTAAPALASLADGRALYADGTGRLFVLEMRDGRLALAGAYALREDRARHATEPRARAPSGFYLDDLGAEGERAMEAARLAFEREAASNAIDAAAPERLEARARAVLAAGAGETLLAALRHERYSVRRAAALVLGEAGREEAEGVLCEIAKEEPGSYAAERAEKILERSRHGR